MTAPGVLGLGVHFCGDGVESLGQRLRQRREARGITLEAVTRATRLTRTSLQALEADRFEDMAAPVYVRGFLRLYGQYLDLDIEQLLESYEQQVAVQRDEPAGLAQQSSPQLPDYFRVYTRPSRSLSPAQAFLLVATAAITIVFMWSVNRKHSVQVAGRPAGITAPATARLPVVAPTPMPGTGPLRGQR